MSKPLVSVIIPTHNRARLLREALDSVYAQEGAGEQFEMEVIVVDDASSDATSEIVHKYPTVRYIRLATNRGEAGARNAGLRASRGKYVTFLDDDDVWLAHKLRMQVPVLETNSEIGVVYSQNIIKDEEKEVTWPDAKRAPSGEVFRTFLKEEFISMNTLLVRRDVFKKLDYFDESLPTMTHYDMFLRLAFHVPFAFVAGNVAINRVNRRGAFHSRLGGEGGYAEMAPRVVEKALAMLPDNADSARIREETHAALVSRMLYWLGQIGELDRVRLHIRTALKACPWMLTEPLARESMLRSLRRLAPKWRSPIAVVRVVCAEIKIAARGQASDEWFGARRLLADVWGDVADALRWTGSRELDRVAAYSALYAFLYNPFRLKPTKLLRIAGRAFVGTHVDRIRRALKQTAP